MLTIDLELDENAFRRLLFNGEDMSLEMKAVEEIISLRRKGLQDDITLKLFKNRLDAIKRIVKIDGLTDQNKEAMTILRLAIARLTP